MLKSELARELGIDASVMTKKCKDYFAAVGKPDERHLSTETVRDLREASALLDSNAAKTWKEAISRVLGNYTEPVPPESVRHIVQRLDHLESRLTKVAEEVSWIAKYLRERADRQGASKGAGQAAAVQQPELQLNP
ncbi:hypothetical protein GO986_18620 [Deinococcus sp. HMF7620]|uniref:Uncharacterized protein n=1 Tax=Deinococcus arboris TaxID=2682977 RepID=A0A7C9LQQ0_9DEIO|nr:hypothetical protein [Deinococcus arboris]MVN88756.1 hypothetical protein [Deinococcus arboris]